MKTTIELPEDLFLEAKQYALVQGTTLKALIETGLRNTLTQSKLTADKPFRFSVITSMAQPADGQADLNAFIDQMRNEQLDQLLPK
jgi:hypothetical protein